MLVLQHAEEVLGIIATAREQAAGLGLPQGAAVAKPAPLAPPATAASAGAGAQQGLVEGLAAGDLPGSVFAPIAGAGASDRVSDPAGPAVELWEDSDGAPAARAPAASPAPGDPSTAAAGAPLPSPRHDMPAAADAAGAAAAAGAPASAPGTTPAPGAAVADSAAALALEPVALAPLVPSAVPSIPGLGGGSALSSMFGSRTPPQGIEPSVFPALAPAAVPAIVSPGSGGALRGLFSSHAGGSGGRPPAARPSAPLRGPSALGQGIRTIGGAGAQAAPPAPPAAPGSLPAPEAAQGAAAPDQAASGAGAAAHQSAGPEPCAAVAPCCSPGGLLPFGAPAAAPLARDAGRAPAPSSALGRLFASTTATAPVKVCRKLRTLGWRNG